MQLVHFAHIHVSPKVNTNDKKTHDMVNKLAFYYGLQKQFQNNKLNGKEKEYVAKRWGIR